MVSLEELVTLVTRGVPEGDLSRRGRGGDAAAAAGAVSSPGSKEHEAGDGSINIVAETKISGEVGRRSAGNESAEEKRTQEEDGDSREEQKQSLPQQQQDSNRDNHDENSSSVTAAVPGAAQSVGAAQSSSASEEPGLPLRGDRLRSNSSLVGTSTSSWFRDRPEESGAGSGGGAGAAGGDGGERPLPAGVRWAFMWLLDSLFFNVKEPVEGLDRHPVVHALLENLLAVRARTRAALFPRVAASNYFCQTDRCTTYCAAQTRRGVSSLFLVAAAPSSVPSEW